MLGLGKYVIAIEELGEVLIDTVLEAGDVLYVPHGFPHTTHTAHDHDEKDTSIHLKLGLDTHV